MVEVWSLEAGGGGAGDWGAGLAVRLKGEKGVFTLLVADEDEGGGGGKRRGERERHQWHISLGGVRLGGVLGVWKSIRGCYSR